MHQDRLMLVQSPFCMSQFGVTGEDSALEAFTTFP